MMRCGIGAAVLGLLLGGAAAAQAQGSAPQERINGALTRAGQVGIPVALLENKIAEGKAKGYPAERIAVAIERRLGALERARQVLRGQTGAAATLSLAADAMEAGVSESVLKAIATSAPGDRRNVAIAALTELVNRGQASEVALQRVQDALKRGPDALSNLAAEASSSGRGNGNDARPQDDSSRGGGNSGSGNSARADDSASGGGNSGSVGGNRGRGDDRGGAAGGRGGGDDSGGARAGRGGGGDDRAGPQAGRGGGGDDRGGPPAGRGGGGDDRGGSRDGRAGRNDGRGRPDAGPPAAVPAPGQGSQAGRPDNRGGGSDRPGNSGNSGGGRGNSGRGSGR